MLFFYPMETYSAIRHFFRQGYKALFAYSFIQSLQKFGRSLEHGSISKHNRCLSHNNLLLRWWFFFHMMSIAQTKRR